MIIYKIQKMWTSNDKNEVLTKNTKSASLKKLSLLLFNNVFCQSFENRNN